ncbi:hypothetical protein E2C01_008244 [Portunus trituberculatus]|uniref:Uncharacterized protein n=1 Tax=Portunus trituberculatus TaxID=210409 RepID=A0A5B7D086_PORTR|nr:hypothetical protein [Portunus trituberculatus]
MRCCCVVTVTGDSFVDWLSNRQRIQSVGEARCRVPRGSPAKSPGLKGSFYLVHYIAWVGAAAPPHRYFLL